MQFSTSGLDWQELPVDPKLPALFSHIASSPKDEEILVIGFFADSRESVIFVHDLHESFVNSETPDGQIALDRILGRENWESILQMYTAAALTELSKDCVYRIDDKTIGIEGDEVKITWNKGTPDKLAVELWDDGCYTVIGSLDSDSLSKFVGLYTGMDKRV